MVAACEHAEASPHASKSIGQVNWNDIRQGRFMTLTCATSILEIGLTYPAWIIKTNQQMTSGNTASPSVSLILRRLLKSQYKQRLVSKSQQTALKHKSRQLRMLAKVCYKGYGTYMSLALPSYVLYSSAYIWSRFELGFDSETCDSSNSSIWKNLAPLGAGLFADLLCLTTYVPAELITQRLQVAAKERPSTVQSVANEIFAKAGVAGFYRGFGATVVTSSIASGVIWLTYEHSKKYLQRSVPGDSLILNAASSMCAGSLAFATGSIVSNPLDVVKTRIQVGKPAESGSTGNLKEFADGVKELIRTEGWKGAFTRGLGAKLCSAIPLGAISCITFETVLYLSKKK